MYGRGMMPGGMMGGPQGPQGMPGRGGDRWITGGGYGPGGVGSQIGVGHPGMRGPQPMPPMNIPGQQPMPYPGMGGGPPMPPPGMDRWNPGGPPQFASPGFETGGPDDPAMGGSGYMTRPGMGGGGWSGGGPEGMDEREAMKRKYAEIGSFPNMPPQFQGGGPAGGWGGHRGGGFGNQLGGMMGGGRGMPGGFGGRPEAGPPVPRPMPVPYNRYGDR